MLLKVKPEAAEWQNKVVRNYDKLCQLFAKDRATGENVEIATKIRRRRATILEENNVEEPFNTIDDIDFMVSQNDIILENLNASKGPIPEATAGNSPNHSQPGGNAQYVEIDDHDEVPSKNKKRRKGRVDEEVSLLKMGLDNVAQAITNSTDALVKATVSKLPISESEVLNMLIDLGIDEESQDAIYLYLIEKLEKLRALFGYPPERRKNLLLQMMRQVNAPTN